MKKTKATDRKTFNFHRIATIMLRGQKNPNEETKATDRKRFNFTEQLQ